MDVFIDIFLGPSYRIIKVDKGDSVFDIKNKIKESLGIPFMKQTLLFKDKFLHENNVYVEELNIVNNSRIHLFFPIRHINSDHSQIEEFLYGPKFKFTIQDSPTSKQDLTKMFFGDFEFDENQFLSKKDLANIQRALIAANDKNNTKEAHQDQSIENQEYLPMENNEMMVKISMPYNRGIKIEVTVNASDNVEELWKEIEIHQKKYRLNLSKDEYVLKHKEKDLEDDKSFVLNGVSQGDTIEIIVRNTKQEESTTQEESSTQEDQA